MGLIQLKKTYPTTKEVVWDFLTQDTLLSSWCMPSKGFSLEKNQEFVFEIKPNAFFNGTFHNTVMDFDAGVFLSYKCTSAKPRLDTVVKWTLVEEDGKTTLSLEHSGFRGSQWLTKIMLASGWKKMMREHLLNKILTKGEKNT